MATRAAFRRATETLECLVEEARNTGQFRLPNVKELCELARVCNVTMLKAVGHLREQGVLSVSHGRGINVVPVASARAVADEPRRTPGPKWRRVRAALDKDIVQGVYRAGAEMPPPKELSVRYGVCYRTLKRALDSLVESGDIVPSRRTYRVPAFSTAQHTNTVVLFGGPATSAQLEPSSRSLQFLRMLQQECARSAVRLTTQPIDESIAYLQKGSPVLGSMVWASGMGREPLARVLESLVHRRVPVSVFDDVGGFRPPGAAANRFKVFTVANSQEPGRRAGRYLLNLGHRTIAYVSPFHQDGWSRRRLQGLRQAFESTGLPDGVRSFVLENSPYRAPLMGRIVVVQRALESLLARDSLLRSQPLGHSALVRTAETLHAQLISFRRRATRDRLGSLLTSAISDTGITAWVAANDRIAVDCIELLEEHGRQVPRDVSVMGFDDGMDALLNSLTSYNFNASAVMHAMLDYILAYGSRRRSTRAKRPVEVEGFVTERGTTAKPIRRSE